MEVRTRHNLVQRVGAAAELLAGVTVAAIFTLSVNGLIQAHSGTKRADDRCERRRKDEPENMRGVLEFRVPFGLPAMAASLVGCHVELDREVALVFTSAVSVGRWDNFQKKRRIVNLYDRRAE